LSPVRPATATEARAGLALPPGNDGSRVTEVWVPAGTRIQVGVAGPRFGQPGGWEQIELMQAIPVSCFGDDESLPP
jgi:hypothetical protein